jgi:hypothetical protein
MNGIMVVCGPAGLDAGRRLASGGFVRMIPVERIEGRLARFSLNAVFRTFTAGCRIGMSHAF